MPIIDKTNVEEIATNKPDAVTAFNLNAAAIGSDGLRNFAVAYANTEQMPYFASDGAGLWESGQGTFTSGAPNTLDRGPVSESSNAGAAVDFSGGGAVILHVEGGANSANISRLVSKSHLRFNNKRNPVKYVSSVSVKINGAGSAVVDGKILQWSSDIVWSGTSGVAPLSAENILYGYLYDNTGTVALELSTVAPEYSLADEYYRKTGDSSRRCIWSGYTWLAASTGLFRITDFDMLLTSKDTADIYFKEEIAGADTNVLFSDAPVVAGTAIVSTQFTLALQVPVHALFWYASGKIKSTAVNTDGILAISPRAIPVGLGAGHVFNYTVRAGNPINGGLTFFGRAMLPIVEPQTSYYILDLRGTNPTVQIEIAGFVLPL